MQILKDYNSDNKDYITYSLKCLVPEGFHFYSFYIFYDF